MSAKHNLPELFPGHRYWKSMQGSVDAILTPMGIKRRVVSQGTQFVNYDAWTGEAFAQHLCDWLSRNPKMIPAGAQLTDVIEKANKTRCRDPHIRVAKMPQWVTHRTALAIVGGGYHEAWHTKYSKRDRVRVDEVQPILDIAEQVILGGGEFDAKMRGLLMTLHHLIEDIRIERRGNEDFPGAMQPMRDLQDFILDLEAKARSKGAKVKNVTVSSNARSIMLCCLRDLGLGYSTQKSRAMIDFYKQTAPGAVQLLAPGGLLAPALHEAKNLSREDGMGSLRVAMKIVVELWRATQSEEQSEQPEMACPQCGAGPKQLIIRSVKNDQGVKIKGRAELECKACGFKTEFDLPDNSLNLDQQQEEQEEPEEKPEVEDLDQDDVGNGADGFGDDSREHMRDAVNDQDEQQSSGADQSEGDESEGSDDAEAASGGVSSQEQDCDEDEDEDDSAGAEADGDEQEQGDEDEDDEQEGRGAGQFDEDDDEDEAASAGDEDDAQGMSADDEEDESDDGAEGAEDVDDEEDESDAAAAEADEEDDSDDADFDDLDGLDGADEWDDEADETGDDDLDGEWDDGDEDAEADEDARDGGERDEDEDDAETEDALGEDSSQGAAGDEPGDEPDEDWEMDGEEFENLGGNHDLGQDPDSAMYGSQEVLDGDDGDGVMNHQSALQEALEEVEEAERKDMKRGERLWNPIDLSLDEARVVRSRHKDFDTQKANEMLASVRPTVTYLRARLRTIMKAQEMTDVTHGVRRGRRMSQRTLVDTVVDLESGRMPTRAYQTEDAKPDTSFAVAVVLDQSYSMQDVGVEKVAKTMMVMVDSIEGVGGKTMAFGFRDGKRNPAYGGHVHSTREHHRVHGIRYDIFKTWEENFANVKWRFAHTHADGWTPMADGIQYGLAALNERREAHRILAVITDGDPTDPHDEVMRRQLRHAAAAGVHVIGIGIGHEAVYVKTLFPDHVWAESIDAMPQPLLKKLNELCDFSGRFRGKRVQLDGAVTKRVS